MSGLCSYGFGVGERERRGWGGREELEDVWNRRSGDNGWPDRIVIILTLCDRMRGGVFFF